MKLGLVILAGLMINIGRAAPPANDMYSSATIISGDSGTIAGSNVGATIEPGEPYPNNVLTASVWYQWTASTNETTKFDLHGSAFVAQAYVLVYTNSASGIGNLQWTFAYGQIGGGPSTKANFQAVAGQTYYISVAGSSLSATGAIKLTWSSGPPQLAHSGKAAMASRMLCSLSVWASSCQPPRPELLAR